MNPGSTAFPDPAINITVGQREVTITQQRPNLVASLAGVPVSQALRLIPTLLPICGFAQSIAASRAVASTREQSATLQELEQQSKTLWREQALAAAWRLTVDWPDLLSQPRQLKTLKAARQADSDHELGTILQQLLPGVGNITGLDQLQVWMDSSDCTAAEVIRLTRDAGGTVADDPSHLYRGQTMDARARWALASTDFDAHSPRGGPLQAGPLAMARTLLTQQVGNRHGNSSLARLLAMVLDSSAIAEAADDQRTLAEVGSTPTGGPPGTGSAMTSRGPVYHQVSLDDDEWVEDWRVLAPTDWHFAPRGPLEQALNRAVHENASGDYMRVLIASFDPCAPWTLHTNRVGA